MRSQGVRRLGSAALDLCYVASGRLDGYWEMTLKLMGPGSRGAASPNKPERLSPKSDGGEDILTPPFSILAANRDIHPLMLDVLLESARADL